MTHKVIHRNIKELERRINLLLLNIIGNRRHATLVSPKYTFPCTTLSAIEIGTIKNISKKYPPGKKSRPAR
jgi:hypothetical protein